MTDNRPFDNDELLTIADALDEWFFNGAISVAERVKVDALIGKVRNMIPGVDASA